MLFTKDLSISNRMYVYLLCLYFLCLPLNAVDMGGMGSVLACIALLPMVWGIFHLRLIHPPKMFYSQIFYYLICFVSLLWSIDFEESLHKVIVNFQFLVLTTSVLFFDYSSWDLQKIKKALVWSSRMTAISILIFSDISFGRLTLEGIFVEDPNYICAYLIFGVVFSVQKMMLVDKNDKFCGFIELLFYLFVVLCTASRGGLMAIGAATIAYLLSHKNFSWKSILKTCFVIGILFMCIIVLLDYLPNIATERFTLEHVIEGGGSGRITIWSQGLYVFLASDLFGKIFGCGYGTVMKLFGLYSMERIQVMHNMFLQSLVEIGVVGLYVYSSMIFNYTKGAFRIKDKFAFACISGMVIMSLSTSIGSFKPYYNIMMYILICYRVVDKEKVLRS